MATSDIAQVVSDVVNKHIQHGILALRDKGMVELSRKLISKPTVVDASVIYEGIREKQSINLYDDHPCVAPPWDEFIVAYENRHGNVIVMHANAFDVHVIREHILPWRSTDEDNVIDWSRVRWEIDIFVYAGGQSARGHMQTAGPLMMWRYAIYEDGHAADLYWIDLWDEKDEGTPVKTGLDMANWVMMGALNFLNCRNVQIVEPQRDRAERKRLEKIGVKVHEINIYPVGKRSTYTKPNQPGAGIPLTSVRGYFATYTEERPLFGKYPGRFWIPQHARGKKDLGERQSSYRLRRPASKLAPKLD